jgi:glycosyltransferase involved in cell wall biosynthesis
MNEKKVHVLFISSWYPNKLRPMLGIFVRRQAAALAKECNVSAIYIGADDNESIEETVEDNVYTIRFYYKRVNGAIPIYSSLIRLRRYIAAWNKAIDLFIQKRGKPDIINSAIVFPVSIIAKRLKKKWQVPYVISEHWTGYLPEDGRYKGFMMKRLAKTAISKASAVITDSSRLKNRMQELGLSNQYYSIPNIVDTNLFNIANTKTSTASINFIHISSFDDEQKNVSGIIKAFARVISNYPNTSLTLVGDGEMKSTLQKLSHSLNLDNAITFTGLKTGTELVQLIQQANAFILFSNYENMPCVMLETMACGVPVIGTRTGDVPEVINSKNGILIDARNEDQLAEAMITVIKNKGNFDPLTIRAEVVNKVSPTEIAKQFLAVYNKVLSRDN